MATKKNAKPQPVTFYRPETWWRPAAVMNESGSTSRTLEDLAIYDASGVICWLDSCELGDVVKGNPVTVSLPIIWKTYKAPDFTETRAHIVIRDSFGERKYTLFIPRDAVTIESVKDIASKGTGYTERYYTVAEFPAKFSKWYRHPFNRYAAKDAAEQLAKKAYDVLTYDEINTPRAQKYLTEFWQQLQEFAAEAARIEAMSASDFIAECLESANA